MSVTWEFMDQMGRKVLLQHPPKRIISLVPSQTELLYDLGLRDEVVGQTLFCIHPDEMHQTKPRVGGTKKLRMDMIASLKPDLIIANKEENERNQLEQLMQQYPVWISDIQNLNDALEMIRQVGALVDRSGKAETLADEIEIAFQTLRPSVKPLSCLYLIWKDPIMVAGKDTFIQDMLVRNGWNNLVLELPGRYPVVEPEMELHPDIVLLSSEPFPFNDQHFVELQERFPGAQLLMVDGEAFSWYGSRLLRSVDYFLQLQQSLNK